MIDHVHTWLPHWGSLLLGIFWCWLSGWLFGGACWMLCVCVTLPFLCLPVHQLWAPAARSLHHSATCPLPGLLYDELRQLDGLKLPTGNPDCNLRQCTMTSPSYKTRNSMTRNVGNAFSCHASKKIHFKNNTDKEKCEFVLIFNSCAY